LQMLKIAPAAHVSSAGKCLIMQFTETGDEVERASTMINSIMLHSGFQVETSGRNDGNRSFIKSNRRVI